ncbi:MAG: alanine racemase [Desulfobacterales bacterium]|jgi:alanine racemase
MTTKPNRDLIWAEVDLAAIGHNVSALKKAAGTARFMAVVKANAYGHGALPVAERALQSGADWLGVARLDEALALREAGIDAPILVFGHTPPERADELIENGVRPTVFDPDTARRLSESVSATGDRLKVHVKVDSGMGRLGILPDAHRPGAPPDAPPEQAAAEIAAIGGLGGIEIEGIYTHFASADDSDKTSARRQLSIFTELLDALERSRIRIPIRHAANSAAIIDLPDTHLDMVRAGISLYGLAPSADVKTQAVGLKPAMALKARIVHLKRVPAGFAVSYGSTYHTAAPTTIATVPVGYADGYSRSLSNRGRMLVRGKSAPITGRVCMDQTMLDVGHIEGVQVGDEVVAFGTQDGAALPADELADMLGTINYEIVSAIMARVPRVYVG